MTCSDLQRWISRELDGEGAPNLGRHLDECADCRRFEEVSVEVAANYRSAVLASQRALVRLDAPRRRRLSWLAVAAALMMALFTVPRPSPVPPSSSEARATLPVEVPDLPWSLRSEPDVDLLAMARELPLSLGDAWPAEDVEPRSVAE